jgi:hypothetical protein
MLMLVLPPIIKSEFLLRQSELIYPACESEAVSGHEKDMRGKGEKKASAY